MLLREGRQTNSERPSANYSTKWSSLAFCAKYSNNAENIGRIRVVIGIANLHAIWSKYRRPKSIGSVRNPTGG